jgi:hypothetical protein
MSRPSFSFYPDDWLNDLKLRTCSASTRGIWADLICLMHQGTPYGHLAVDGIPLPVKHLAQRCNVSTRELSLAVAELDRAGVSSRTPEGTLFSRRMVRDEEKRLSRGQHGAKSLMNPNVPRPKDTMEGIHHTVAEGIHTARDSVTSIEPVEVKVKDSKKVNKNGNSFNCDEVWAWFSSPEGYPGHRLNLLMDCQLFVAVVETEAMADRIRAILPKFKACDEWQRGIIPAAKTWLSERRFLMEPPPTIEKGKPWKEL